MIKIENVEVVGWEHVIRGMRNPKNSWDLSDSKYWEESAGYPYDEPEIGPNDHKLMMNLAKGGPVHAKYRRMITVYLDITAPLYWWPEMDTYKIGVVRNSCSFMHKGVSKPFDIKDFSVKDDRIYEILSPLEKKTYELTYPYETDEYRLYTDHNGHTYRVYRNGFVIRESFEYTDNYGKGRTRIIDENEATVYQNNNGYFVIKLAGKNGGHMLLSNLVASVWCDRPEGTTQVDHKNGDKGNNSAENLQWVTASENMRKSIENGTHDNLNSLHRKYRVWKCLTHVIPIEDRIRFKKDYESGLTHKELAEKWDISPSQANNLRYGMINSEHEDLFNECYVWEHIIEEANRLRLMYLVTKDDKIFQAIRAILPQGYNQRSTLMMNYEVLHNIYHSRKYHRLDEWRVFCKWIESLPYSEIITDNTKTEEE